MVRGKKKTIGSIGTVLKKISGPEALKKWVDFICAQEPWASAGVTAENLLGVFQDPEFKWQFYVASNPKDAKSQGFDYEDGFIAFTIEGAAHVEQSLLKNATPLSSAAFILLNYGKPNHKTVAKYLLSAAERIISEKNKTVCVLSPKEDTLTTRIYKPSNYEERTTVQGVLAESDVYALLSKTLE
jgi:hypothetical protein